MSQTDTCVHLRFDAGKFDKDFNGYSIGMFGAVLLQPSVEGAARWPEFIVHHAETGQIILVVQCWRTVVMYKDSNVFAEQTWSPANGLREIIAGCEHRSNGVKDRDIAWRGLAILRRFRLDGRPPGTTDFSDEVEFRRLVIKVIKSLLEDGKTPTELLVAEQMGTTDRSLQRTFNASGLKWKKLVTEAHRQLLKEHGMNTP